MTQDNDDIRRFLEALQSMQERLVRIELLIEQIALGMGIRLHA